MADENNLGLNADNNKGNDQETLKPSLNDSWYGVPVEEVDPLLIEDTFCVISKRFSKDYIYRFSLSKSLFLFGPLNPVRKFAICLTTHRLFEPIIMLTILVNCVTLAMTTNQFDRKNGYRIVPSYDYYVDRIEYGCLAIYTLEVILKVIAKGFALNKYSYLRSRWNLLDFFVVVTSYIPIVKFVIDLEENIEDDHQLNFLRTLRVLRGVKTFSIIPGLKIMLNALLGAIKQLVEVIAIILISIMIFALIADDIFMGKLRQKCVVDKGGPQDKNRLKHRRIEDEPAGDRDRLWTKWVNDWTNWKPRIYPEGEPFPCGNVTGTRPCGPGYTCIGHLGKNPDAGWTNFDTFFYSILSTYQLITLDFWERLYDVMLSTSGVISLIFFLLVIFLGGYYLLNLMLGVIAMSYQGEVDLQRKRPVSLYKKLELNRNRSNFSFENISQLHIFKLTKLRKIHEADIETRVKRMRHADRGDSAYNTLSETGLKNMDVEMSLYKMPLGAQLDWEDVEEDEMEAGNDEATGRENELNEHNSEIDLENDKGGKKSDAWGTRNRVDYFFRNYLGPVVNHPIFEWLIFLFIVLNTVFLAMEHHRQSAKLEFALKVANHVTATVFVGVFTMEFLLKLLALQGDYFRSGWNRFDMVIVLVSYTEVVLIDSKAGIGLTVLRSLRLLRVFKLAQKWLTMKTLLNIILATSGALGNLTLVILLFAYIFAVMGMLIIGEKYTYAAFRAVKKPLRFPRWHWGNCWHAFLMVFRVLCGEWVEPLHDCLIAHEYYLSNHSKGQKQSHYLTYVKCFVIFIPISVVLNLLCLNLFLALLLHSFDFQMINAQREKEKEMNKRVQHIKDIVDLWKTKMEDELDEHSVISDEELHEKEFAKLDIIRSSMPFTSPGAESGARRRFKDAVNRVIWKNRMEKTERAISLMEKRQKRERKGMLTSGMFLTSPGIRHTIMDYDLTPEGSEILEDLSGPKDCIPAHVFTSKYCLCNHKIKRKRKAKAKGWCGWCSPKKKESSANRTAEAEKREKRSCGCCICCRRRKLPGKQSHLHAGPWFKFRWMCATIVSNSLFEYFILVLIFASSIILCFEDIHLDSKPQLKRDLCYANFVFVSIFCIEMTLKIGAIGIWGYFTNFWTILDAFIVSVSLFLIYYDLTLNTCGNNTGRTGAAANLGGLKALRTLRALRPLRAISRWQGIKTVVNALIYAIPSIFNVLLVCLLIWLIFSIMGVEFFKGQFYHCVEGTHGFKVYPEAAPNKAVCCAKADTHGFSWTNTISSFDNVLEGYLSLFQIATFEGWVELMRASVDMTGVDKAPVMNNRVAYYLFYVVFIMFGSFFALRLFVGVVIDNYNMLRKKTEGNMLEVLLTPMQRNYYITLKNLAHKKPKPIPIRPTSPFFAFFYDIAMSRRLEIFIFILIFFNLVNESLEFYGEPLPYTEMVLGFGDFFTLAYVLEAVVKIVGLGTYYFTVPWNMYDFIISLASCLDVFTDGKTISMPLPPPMIRFVRVFRIGRILRHVKSAKGIRKLIYALVVSLPALLNIGALLGLITFIYAILGMALFGRSPHRWTIDEMFNFETFFNASKLLLRLMTAAGWNVVLDSLTVIEPECGTFRHLPCGLPGENDCPVRGLVIAYLVSYIVLTFLIVISLYIAIIFENYADACDEEEMGLVEDDLDMFYHLWVRFDPSATQFINFDKVPDLLHNLSKPFKIPKPNTMAIVMFNLPIARGYKVHCLDIIQALIKHILGPVEDSKEFRKLQQQIDRKFRLQFPSRSMLDIVSSSKVWKLESNAARIIQRAWKAYLKRKLQRAKSKSLSKGSNHSRSRSNTSRSTPKIPRQVESHSRSQKSS